VVYLDNAATSFPKPETVYRAVDICMREYCANPGRSGHYLALESGKAVMRTREVLCSFFGIRNVMQLVFTKNATEAINIALKGYLRPGRHVVITPMEHNAVIRPLKTLERDIGISIDIIRGNQFGEIDPWEFRKAVKSNTALFVSTLSSNVNGTIMPVREIGKIASDLGIPFMVDASQGAGTLEIDAEEAGIDILAFPGHKCLFGPQGTGGLYVRENIKLNTLVEGGTGSNSEYVLQPDIMPDRFESGTLNTPGIAGLCEGVNFISETGKDRIREHKYLLTHILHEGLKEIKGIKLYSIDDPEKNSGIIAFLADGYDSSELANILDRKYGIASRGGLHCSPLAHQTLGTMQKGLLRLSPGYFNTVEDIYYTIESIRKACN